MFVFPKTWSFLARSFYRRELSWIFRWKKINIVIVQNLVTWRSKKRSVVASSSAKAKYRAMTQSVCELLRLQKLLEVLILFEKGNHSLYYDNKVAIITAQNPIQHDWPKHIEIDRDFIKEKVTSDRPKHIEIDRGFIKEKVTSGTLSLLRVPKRKQLAHMFTKGLPILWFASWACATSLLQLEGSVDCVN